MLVQSQNNFFHCRDSTWLDPGVLECVPQNSDATIRLLKARIKSLEEQLGTALTLNQGKLA